MNNLNFIPKLLVITGFLFLVLISCHDSKNQKLRAALELAGENRNELEKVLDHYSSNPADSLKLEAAKFLIENMRWHYGSQVNPSDEFWKLFLMEDSLVRSYLRDPTFAQDPTFNKTKDALEGYKYSVKKFLINDAIKESEINTDFQPDLKQFNAEDIINIVDVAFEVKDSWCENLSFEQFKEYILPYRVNNEPVYPIMKKLHQHFIKLNATDSLKGNMFKTIKFFNEYIKLFHWDWWDENISLPDLGFYDIFYFNNRNFTCAERTAILSQMLRSIGIPVIEVYTPTWRISKLGHSWCGVPGSGDSLTLFSAIYQNPGDNSSTHDPSLATKIYAKTFAPQPGTPFYLKASLEEIPVSYQNPCIKDVTNTIVRTQDVEIKLNQIPPENNLCWFAIFIQGSWIPIGWGKINKNTGVAHVKNIPVGLTGLACLYENGQFIPYSNILTVEEENIIFIEPRDTTENIFLTRKFPQKTRLQNSLIGTKIQGANTPDFADSVTLHTIIDTLNPYLQDISFSNSNEYKYYRLYAKSWWLNVAEFEFITENKSPGTVDATMLPILDKGNNVQKKYFKYIGDIVSIMNKPDSSAFDGNMLSYYTHKWIGLGFDSPVQINRIRIAPRNAHNGIVRGDNYQLLYWDDEWMPAGVQQAEFNYLEYEDVPAGTLYWLRNLDHGKEEQPFFYINGKQIFSNQPETR